MVGYLGYLRPRPGKIYSRLLTRFKLFRQLVRYNKLDNNFHMLLTANIQIIVSRTSLLGDLPYNANINYFVVVSCKQFLLPIAFLWVQLLWQFRHGYCFYLWKLWPTRTGWIFHRGLFRTNWVLHQRIDFVRDTVQLGGDSYFRFGIGNSPKKQKNTYFTISVKNTQGFRWEQQRIMEKLTNSRYF